jgi:hypothetical protein
VEYLYWSSHKKLIDHHGPHYPIIFHILQKEIRVTDWLCRSLPPFRASPTSKNYSRTFTCITRFVLLSSPSSVFALKISRNFD